MVPVNHTNGLEGLRGGVYCHPGFDVAGPRWSPRVLKGLEELVMNFNQRKINVTNCQDATGPN